MLLKDSVFVLWIKMQFKDEGESDFSYWTFKTVSGVIKVTLSKWPLLYGHLSNMDTSLCPFGVSIREVRLYFIILLISVHISARTLRCRIAERTQIVLRIPLMDKSQMTIKTEYLPGKLWGGNRSHCFVAILMFLSAPRLIPDCCFPIATIRTYKIYRRHD